MSQPLTSLFLAALLAAAADPVSCAADHHWPLDSSTGEGLTVRGKVTVVAGVTGQGPELDGESMLEIKNSVKLAQTKEGFTFTVWVNPFAPGDGKQIVAGKNRYSLDQREWGMMLDEDGLFRLYVWQEKWRTVAARTEPKAGHWHQIGMVLRPDRAELWVNGKLAGSMTLSGPILKTTAPVTLGGINDNGHLEQLLFGALDEARLYDRPLPATEMAALYHPVTTTLAIPERPKPPHVPSDPAWGERAKQDGLQDRCTVVFDGKSPDKLACDTTLRLMPDGSWVMVMLGGGDREPDPRNQVFLTRSRDEGKTWSPMQPLDFGLPREGDTSAMVPSELMVHKGRCTLFFATHNGKFSGWLEWMVSSDDSCTTWAKPLPAPGRLHQRTFIRNHIVTRDGRILLPFQHYIGAPGPLNPRNGVLISRDGGRIWTEHGDIRISSNNTYRGWAENNIVELADGRIAMIIRADRLGGVLYYAESADGGATWPEFAQKTEIPNPGSKATLYGLDGDVVALLHNPNPKRRTPLALWVSFDGMKNWPYQRVLAPKFKGVFNYPDGFVSADKQWLHFAFDHNRDKAVYVGAKLPAPSSPDDTR